MGQMKRAEERERQARLQRTETRNLLLRWTTCDHALHVEFLDPRSCQAVARPRVWRDPATLTGLIARSLTPLQPGPRAITFAQRLAAGAGELEVTISREQYARLTQPEPGI